MFNWFNNWINVQSKYINSDAVDEDMAYDSILHEVKDNISKRILMFKFSTMITYDELLFDLVVERVVYTIGKYNYDRICFATIHLCWGNYLVPFFI